MSFGFGIGDAIAIVQVTMRLYSGWKDAPREFADIGVLLDSFHQVLLDLQMEIDNPDSLISRSGKLRQVRIVVDSFVS
jgi:hypothetical protein